MNFKVPKYKIQDILSLKAKFSQAEKLCFYLPLNLSLLCTFPHSAIISPSSLLRFKTCCHSRRAATLPTQFVVSNRLS